MHAIIYAQCTRCESINSRLSAEIKKRNNNILSPAGVLRRKRFIAAFVRGKSRWSFTRWFLSPPAARTKTAFAISGRSANDWEGGWWGSERLFALNRKKKFLILNRRLQKIPPRLTDYIRHSFPRTGNVSLVFHSAIESTPPRPMTLYTYTACCYITLSKHYNIMFMH